MPANVFALIACASKKLEAPAPAYDLYTPSTLFLYSRMYAARLGIPRERTFILSAEHGLLPHDKVVAPYNTTLVTMTQAERKAWALGVNRELAATIPPGARVVVLAGMSYSAFLDLKAYAVEYPLGTLSFGNRLKWLKEQLTHNG